jgi:predicted nucleic-acid-binding protein
MIGLDTNVVVRFPDALIGALGAKVGCSHTVTFDQKALWLPAFQLL